MTPAIATSTRSIAASARQAGRSTMLIADRDETAPRTAAGRYCTGSVGTAARRRRWRRRTSRRSASGAHRLVHRGAGAAGADRERLRETSGGVCRSHHEQLLRGAHVLAAPAGERPRGQDLVGERDEEDGERRRHELEHVGERRRGQARAGQARRERADRRDPVAGEVECPRGGDRADDDEQRAGTHGRKRRRSSNAANETTLDGDCGSARRRRARAPPRPGAAAARSRRSAGRAASPAGR